MSESSSGLLLKGLSGGNPLGFLAAVGTAVVARETFPALCLGWKATGGGWTPLLSGCDGNQNEFAKQVWTILKNTSMSVFEAHDRLPFAATEFVDVLRDVQRRSSMADRRNADFLSGFGTEIYPDEKGHFQDSTFRMVRSGDSAGHGFPFYVADIRRKTDLEAIKRILFQTWDYRDEGYSLRWDPMEDQRYALRWRDPSKSGLAYGPGSMHAANSLAVEALRWFPTFLSRGKRARTTGFHRPSPLENYFVWPIWTPLCEVETLRSLLSLEELDKDPLPRESLVRRGIEEVYRSQRIQQNQYYSNFAPAHPI